MFSIIRSKKLYFHYASIVGIFEKLLWRISQSAAFSSQMVVIIFWFLSKIYENVLFGSQLTINRLSYSMCYQGTYKYLMIKLIYIIHVHKMYLICTYYVDIMYNILKWLIILCIGLNNEINASQLKIEYGQIK